MCMLSPPLKGGGKTATSVRDCELSQWVKCWTCKNEDLTSTPANKHKPGVDALAYNPSTGGGSGAGEPQRLGSVRDHVSEIRWKINGEDI